MYKYISILLLILFLHSCIDISTRVEEESEETIHNLVYYPDIDGFPLVLCR